MYLTYQRNGLRGLLGIRSFYVFSIDSVFSRFCVFSWCSVLCSPFFAFLARLGIQSLMCMAQCPVVSMFRIVAMYSVATVVRPVARYSLGSRSFLCVSMWLDTR